MGSNATQSQAGSILRIPMKPATRSDPKSATVSDGQQPVYLVATGQARCVSQAERVATSRHLTFDKSAPGRA